MCYRNIDIIYKGKAFKDCRIHHRKHMTIISQHCEHHMCGIRSFEGGASNGHKSISNVIVTTYS